MKPGIRTTEFWLSLATSLWAIFGHTLPPVAQAVVVGVSSGAYAIARAIAKAAAIPPRPPSPVEGMLTGGR